LKGQDSKMKLTATDFQTLDPGRYCARYGGAEAMAAEDGREYLKHIWEVERPNGSAYRLYAASSCNFGPRAKLRQWVSALLGREVQAGDEVDLDSLKGRRAELVIVTERRPDGMVRSSVDAVLPLQSREPAEACPNTPPAASPRHQDGLFPDDEL
jgi:hypothetical protein